MIILEICCIRHLHMYIALVDIKTSNQCMERYIFDIHL